MDVPFGQTAFLDVHGVRISPGTARIQLWQELEQFATDDGSPTPKPVPSQLLSVQAKTTDDTLIVPLNVVVVVPTANQPEHDFMASFADRRLMEALLDDQWSASTARFPDGPLEVQGKWDVRTSVTRLSPDGRSVRDVEKIGNGPGLFVSQVRGLGVLPDDVFVQCGIQFRLAQFVTIEEDDPTFVRRLDGQNQPICTGALTGSIALHGRFRGKYRSLLTDPNLVTIVFNNLFDHPTCLSRTLGEWAASSNDVVISAQDIASGASSLTQQTLSHELGHSLGLGHSICGTGKKDDLMCKENGGPTFHIPGCGFRNGVALSPRPITALGTPKRLLPAPM